MAGLQMLMLMGVLPAIGRMPLATYAGMWQAMDHFMAVRMRILANATLLVYLVAIGCFLRSRWRGLLWSLLGCFALLITGTAFTITEQLPINRKVQALDLANLPSTGYLQQLRDATIQHFHARGWLSISAFVWLACAIIFRLPGNKFTNRRDLPHEKAYPRIVRLRSRFFFSSRAEERPAQRRLRAES
jgi:hypothetical protein